MSAAEIWKLIAGGAVVILMSVGGALVTVNGLISNKIQTESPYAVVATSIMDTIEKVKILEEGITKAKIDSSILTKLVNEVENLSKIVTELQVQSSSNKESLERIKSVEEITTALRISNAEVKGKLDQLIRVIEDRRDQKP